MVAVGEESESAASNEASATTLSGIAKVPKRIDFGAVLVGVGRNRNLIIRNLSRTEALRVTMAQPASPFALIGGNTLVIPARASQTIAVKFLPLGFGRAAGTLLVRTSDPLRQVVPVTLVGKGKRR